MSQAVLLAAQLQQRSEDLIAGNSSQHLDNNLQQVINDPDLYPLDNIAWTKQNLVNYATTNQLNIPPPWPCKSIKQCLSAIQVAGNSALKEAPSEEITLKVSRKRYLLDNIN